MSSHLNYLREKIFELKQLEINNLSEPTLFEYYSAVILTNNYNQPFYIWKDLSPSQKQNFNLPCRDKGVDISNCSFTILGQSKYYSKNSTVTYGKLSTFLAFDKLNPSIKNIDFCLLRLTESNTSSEVSQMISYKTLKDFPIEKDVFMSYINSIPPPVYADKINIEKQFRSYQQEAENTIISSRLNNKNCIISIPTGGGKTHVSISQVKKTTGVFLILVPTIILMNQWAEEAIKEEIACNSIYKIGTGHNKTISAKNINKYKLVICVYNSFIKIPKTCIDVLASIFVDEAHRIIKPNIYKEEEEPDSKHEEDESYVKEIQKSIFSNNKFILLSATIDNCNGFEYFNYPIRSAIDEGFLSDYQLICPIFNEDPTNRNIAEYIIKKGEAHCIIYTNSIEECERFTGVLNSLLPKCARCVHSDMNNTQVILNSYNNGEFRFLVNVRILVEGFNSPVSSSVLFLHLSSSKTFMIQCIGRILRLHPTKKIANVYMPCSTEDNTVDIRSFIKQLTEYDYKFKEASQDKKIGTYINFEELSVGGEKENENENLSGELKEDIQHKYDIIYNSFGVDSRVNLLLEFVNENNRIPTTKEIYKEVRLGRFWGSIKQGFNNNLYKQYLEKNELLREDYERFRKIREENKDKEVITPDHKCIILLEFVNENNRIPTTKEIYKGIKLGQFWGSIKAGQSNNLYKKYLEQNEILKIEYERFRKIREENKDKEVVR
jgi:superfamily II DNA or RNA helicase